MKSHDLAAIRELPLKELLVQLDECEHKLVRLKFANSLAPIKNPLEIRNLKRHRARLLTWIRTKQETTVSDKA
jgi:ribosomal protein L29